MNNEYKNSDYSTFPSWNDPNNQEQNWSKSNEMGNQVSNNVGGIPPTSQTPLGNNFEQTSDNKYKIDFRNIVMTQEILNSLLADFQPNEIKTNYLNHYYVSATSVINRLNNVLTPFGWSFRIVDTQIVLPNSTFDNSGKKDYGSAYVLGELTICGQTRMHIGSSQLTNIKSSYLAAEIKNATSDCLKKCASLFGIPCVINTSKPNSNNYNNNNNNNNNNYNNSVNNGYSQQNNNYQSSGGYQQNNYQNQGNEEKQYCSDCGYEIYGKVLDFSTKKFGRPVCMNCQKKYSQ